MCSNIKGLQGWKLHARKTGIIVVYCFGTGFKDKQPTSGGPQKLPGVFFFLPLLFSWRTSPPSLELELNKTFVWFREISTSEQKKSGELLDLH